MSLRIAVQYEGSSEVYIGYVKSSLDNYRFKHLYEDEEMATAISVDQFRNLSIVKHQDGRLVEVRFAGTGHNACACTYASALPEYEPITYKAACAL